MRNWFASLPLHRKLIVMTLAVSASALVAAVGGLMLFEVARYRTVAWDDAKGMAQVFAENTAAALVFNDAEAARQVVASAGVRSAVSVVCVYRLDASVLASFSRTEPARCPTEPADRQDWGTVASVAPVVRNGSVVGSVYVERTLSDLGAQIAAIAAAGGLMLLTAAFLAFALAQRLQGLISRPIVMLAEAARAIGRDERREIPSIDAAPDETGALVTAFDDMVRRLVSSNDALRLEVEERRRMQAERELLLAREREASRLKDEFLAAVSHELRTPLNAIVGWTQILSSTTPSPQTLEKAIASLSRNAQAQTRVIEDLLDVSRIITGKLQLAFAAVDLRTVAEAAVEVIAPIAAAKRIHLDVRLPDHPHLVLGDADRLRQVVWNLLSNAVKFTPTGGIITVRVAAGDRGAHTITVSDTGVGIPPEFLSHVFERFRQADGSMAREHGGLGLGLAIVKELTELHGGSVRAASAGSGRGAAFTVTLPALTVAAAASASAEPEAPAPNVPRLDGVSVLVVDDNPDALDVVAATMTSAGASVRIAASGDEALEEFERQRPAIVLCDLAMPRMDGFEVLRHIREIENGGGHATPVIAVTAYASEDSRARCLAAGFQAHIAKPFNAGEMVLAVADAVGAVQG